MKLFWTLALMFLQVNTITRNGEKRGFSSNSKTTGSLFWICFFKNVGLPENCYCISKQESEGLKLLLPSALLIFKYTPLLSNIELYQIKPVEEDIRVTQLYSTLKKIALISSSIRHYGSCFLRQLLCQLLYHNTVNKGKNIIIMPND